MDINKIISIVRSLKEEGGIVNVVGSGGLTGSAEPPGRMDGYDKVIGKMTRRKPPTIIGRGTFPGARTRWKEGLDKNK